MKWEYRIELSLDLEAMQELGDQGWELCAATKTISRGRRIHSTVHYFFKRPKEEQPMRQGYFAGGKEPIPSVQCGIWRHYKGGHYQVLGIAAHSETDELMVVYVSLDGINLPGPRIRVRPLSMWFEQVPIAVDHISADRDVTASVQRFTYIGPELPRL